MYIIPYIALPILFSGILRWARLERFAWTTYAITLAFFAYYPIGWNMMMSDPTPRSGCANLAMAWTFASWMILLPMALVIQGLANWRILRKSTRSIVV